MEASHIIPQNPNSSSWITQGVYNGDLLLAYGASCNVVIINGHTFSYVQSLDGHLRNVTSVEFARTGGRLASASLDLILVSVPQNNAWICIVSLRPVGLVSSLSWSFRGDLLSSTSDSLNIWNIESTTSGLLMCDSYKPLWKNTERYEVAKLSPDGRLLGASCGNEIHIWFRSGDSYINQGIISPTLSKESMKKIKLHHSSDVVSFQWLDQPVRNMYLNDYLRNSLLVITNQKVHIWNEYFTSHGIGFSASLETSCEPGTIGSWISEIKDLENQTASTEPTAGIFLKSYIAQKAFEPPSTKYGYISKPKKSTSYFVIIQSQDVVVYQCTGLLDFPKSNIQIQQIKEHLRFREFFHADGTRWIPCTQPLFALREAEEILLTSLDESDDFVRWRKNFRAKEYQGHPSTLTAVSGNHSSPICQIERHKSLPVIATIDTSGKLYIWSEYKSIAGDEKAVDAFRPWGSVHSQNISSVKWTNPYALLLAGTNTGEMQLFKWKTDTHESLMMPTIEWQVVSQWQGYSSQCISIDVGMFDLKSQSFIVAGLFKDEGVMIWKVQWENKSFNVEEMDKIPGKYIQVGVYSTANEKEEVQDSSQKHLVYVLETSKVTCYSLSPLEKLWQKPHSDLVQMLISAYLILVTNSQLFYYSLQSGDLLSVLNCHSDEPVIACNFVSTAVTEMMVIAQGSTVYIFGQEFFPSVSKSQMPWNCVYKFSGKFPVDCLAVTAQNQIVTSNEGKLYIYSALDEENSNMFQHVSKFQKPNPIYHPAYLLELMRMQETECISKILEKLSESIDSAYVAETLLIDLQELSDLSKKPQEANKAQPSAMDDFDWMFSSMPGASSTPTSKKSQFSTKQLIEKLNELDTQIPGLDLNERRELINLVDCFSDIESSARSLDSAASIYHIHVKTYRFIQNLRIPKAQKPTCLSSMEISWVMHTDQQDTLFQTLFTQDMSWPEMRSYGFGIWIQNPTRLKQLVEGLSRRDFRENRDAQAVTLWYLALNKKNLLLGLYKADPQASKIYAFIANDFNNPEWAVKAQKNAFALMKQRRFELCAAFFLLAGKLDSVFEILAGNLADIQLAMTICRLVEGERGPVFMKGVRKYMLQPAIDSGDPWLTSIAYTLLGEHFESVNCFFSLTPFRPEEKRWPDGATPTLSPSHPCMTTFVKILSSSIKVKREMEEKRITIASVDTLADRLALQSGRSFLHAGLPLLNLFTKISSDASTMEKICYTHILSLIADTAESEWKSLFPTLLSQTTFLAQHFGVPREKLVSFIDSTFYQRDQRHYICALYIGLEKRMKALNSIIDLVSHIHIILSRFSRNLNFSVQISTLTSIAQNLSYCISLLQTKKQDDWEVSERSWMMQVCYAVFLALFLATYQTGSWSSSATILQQLEIYVKGGYFELIPDTVRRMTEKLKPISDNNKETALTLWLKFLSLNKLLELFENWNNTELDEYMDFSLCQFNYIDSPKRSRKAWDLTVSKSIARSLGPGRGVKKRPFMSIERVIRRIDVCKQRVYAQFEAQSSLVPIQDKMQLCRWLLHPDRQFGEELCEQFENAEDYETYGQYVKAEKMVYLFYQYTVQDNSILHPKENSDTILKNGVDLFSVKVPVLSFGLNPCNPSLMVIVTDSSKTKQDTIREIDIERSLSYHKRTSGRDLINENPDTWIENLHDSSQDSDVDKWYQPSLSLCLNLLNALQLQKFEKVSRQSESWGQDSSTLMPDDRRKSRNELANTMSTHPQLPYYVTGGNRISMWKYAKEKSVAEFTCSPTKVSCVRFNHFGDKLGACDEAGNFFLYNFDLRVFTPMLTLIAFAGNKMQNFDFVNSGSVIATTGYKPKPFLCFYDALLPPKQCLVKHEEFGGSAVTVLPRYQQLAIGTKTGKLNIYDIRAGKMFTSIKTGLGCINKIETDELCSRIAIGGSFGTVGIYDTIEYSVQDEIELMRSKRNKGGVTDLWIKDKALFASTSTGLVKLVRTTLF